MCSCVPSSGRLRNYTSETRYQHANANNNSPQVLSRKSREFRNLAIFQHEWHGLKDSGIPEGYLRDSQEKVTDRAIYLLVFSGKRKIIFRRRKRRRRRFLRRRGHILSHAHHPISRAVPHLHQPIGNVRRRVRETKKIKQRNRTKRNKKNNRKRKLKSNREKQSAPRENESVPLNFPEKFQSS